MRTLRHHLHQLFLLILCALAATGALAQTDFSAPGAYRVQTGNDTWRDAARNREIPVRIYSPEGSGPFPLIVFSHGLGGSVEAGRAWGQHWASHGFISVHIQHEGSDQAIWRDRTRGALREAFSADKLIDRAHDASFVLDEITRRKAQGQRPFAQADLVRVGMAGHSFGAITTQALAGERAPMTGVEGTLTEPRFAAFIAFSPSARPSSATNAQRFSGVTRPFFSITGSRDSVPLGPTQQAENRTIPFDNMPAGEKYLAVFDGGDHAVFSGMLDGGPLPRPLGNRNRTRDADNDQRIMRLTRAASTAFWFAQLGNGAQSEAGRAYLANGLRGEIGAGDRYARK